VRPAFLAVPCLCLRVGPIGAANGIAGAFSEYVPVLHIVRVPSTGLQSKKALLHHTLGDGRFDAFREMYTHITVSQAEITASNAGKEIDRAIFEALKANRPAYLALPTDMIRGVYFACPLEAC
jgi:TPP-dependent 2-oxoacid decarboxylase